MRIPPPRAARAGVFIGVFAVAAALRLLYLEGALPTLEGRPSPIYGDAAGYYVAGVLLLHGRADPISLAALAEPARTAPAAQRSREFLATRGPGYPLFLAGIFRLFGVDPGPVRVAQALLGGALCALLVWIGRDLAGPRVGALAGLLAAVHPGLVLFTGRMLSETLATTALCLGLALLVQGIRRRGPAWLAGAGLAFAAAALTRPPLLALLPLLPLAAAVALPAGARPQRLLLVGVLGAALLAPLAAWILWLRQADASPIAGSRGLAFVGDVVRTATLPEFRGWRPDSFPPFLWQERAGDWSRVLESCPLYPAPAAANLVFQHLWLAEDLWRELPGSPHVFQRSLTLLAIGGLGLAALAWRRFAPLLGVLAPAAVVWITWIEPRHTLPFLPALILLASLFGVGLLEWSRGARRLAGVGAALAASAGLLFATRLPRLSALAPDADPLVLGFAADAAVVALALLWGALVAGLAARSLGRTRAAFAGLAPAALFALLFAASAYVGSAPRWRAWSLDLAAGDARVVQTLELAAPLAADEVESALWLVDLATPLDPPPLRVGVDGRRLDPQAYRWRRLFCGTATPVIALGAASSRRPQRAPQLEEDRLGAIWCNVYRDGIDAYTGALAGSPQWWGLEVDVSLVVRRQQVALELAGPAPHTLRLGGSYAAPHEAGFVGPSLSGLSPGPGTSLIRWHVLHDWRFWEPQPVASRASRGALEGAAEAGSPQLRSLASALARGRAQLGIRLLVRFRDGHHAVY